ncbi:MAG: right-handed parallel beta-helix repeat-containing protein [Saprospiraceae bacterium]|nr:right-handed parallel beta-helix repeat-containing protein [Saprospiraceae bacterium]
MMRFLFILIFCVILQDSAFAQFDKLKKSLSNTSKSISKSTNETSHLKSAELPEKKSKGTSEKSDKTVTQSTATATTSGTNYYIRPDGKGKEATKDAPAKDLAAIVMQLKAGDVVHIAAGVYTSKADQSSDVMNVPVSIIGGYSLDFNTRDPWGKYKTIFSGSNDISKALTTERIGILTDKGYKDWKGEIIIDGVIVDNGARNYYSDVKEEFIRRKASSEKGMNPTPNTPGIKIRTGSGTKVIIRNCVVTNTAPTQGAIDVQVGKDGSATIENNLIVNNTGEGIMCKSNHHSATGQPSYYVRNNTILFTWKYDAIASHGGNSLMFDNSLTMVVENNVFGFSDYGGVNNIKQCKTVTLKNNLFVGHKKYDYQEYGTGLKLDEMEDYANYITRESDNNYSKEIKLDINKSWAEKYFNRVEISRAEVDAAAKVSNSGANQLRAMFGLPLQASTVKKDAEIWLHRMALEDAVKLGFQSYGNGAGCSVPVL